MNNSREKFEAWANSKGYSTRKLFDGSTYCNDGINISLEAWQAATEQSQKEIAELQAREKVLVKLVLIIGLRAYPNKTKHQIQDEITNMLANVRGE